MRHEYLEVTTASDITTEAEYLEELAAYNQQATQHETRVIQENLGYPWLYVFFSNCNFEICSEGRNDSLINRYLPHQLYRYMSARVEWLLWTNGTDGKLERLALLREANTPKVLLYESQNDGQLDFDEVKKRRVNIFTGVGAGASATRVTDVMEIWDRVLSTGSPDMKDKSTLAVVVKIDNLKTRSAMDIVKSKLPKKTPSAVVTLDPDQPDLLSRIRRGKRAFGLFDQFLKMFLPPLLICPL